MFAAQGRSYLSSQESLYDRRISDCPYVIHCEAVAHIGQTNVIVTPVIVSCRSNTLIIIVNNNVAANIVIVTIIYVIIAATIKVSVSWVELKSADTRELIYVASARILDKISSLLRTTCRRRNNVGMNLL